MTEEIIIEVINSKQEEFMYYMEKRHIRKKWRVEKL